MQTQYDNGLTNTNNIIKIIKRRLASENRSHVSIRVKFLDRTGVWLWLTWKKFLSSSSITMRNVLTDSHTMYAQIGGPKFFWDAGGMADDQETHPSPICYHIKCGLLGQTDMRRENVMGEPCGALVASGALVAVW